MDSFFLTTKLSWNKLCNLFAWKETKFFFA